MMQRAMSHFHESPGYRICRLYVIVSQLVLSLVPLLPFHLQSNLTYRRMVLTVTVNGMEPKNCFASNGQPSTPDTWCKRCCHASQYVSRFRKVWIAAFVSSLLGCSGKSLNSKGRQRTVIDLRAAGHSELALVILQNISMITIMTICKTWNELKTRLTGPIRVHTNFRLSPGTTGWWCNQYTGKTAQNQNRKWTNNLDGSFAGCFAKSRGSWAESVLFIALGAPSSCLACNIYHD